MPAMYSEADLNVRCTFTAILGVILQYVCEVVCSSMSLVLGNQLTSLTYH